MARAISLPHYFHKNGHHEDDAMEGLVVSVRENYFTFNGWAAGEKRDKGSGTLIDRVNENFGTFRDWNG
ncbi:MAG: hypothetical protein ACOY4I_15475 [Bacillota bacterium]